MGRQRIPMKERLEAKFIKLGADDCWLWKLTSQGRYGGIWCPDANRMIAAHRASYEVYVGTIPPGMCVLHKCDVPLCVNPRHLMLGTQLDNIRDRDAKGRQRNNPHRGEESGAAIFTEDQVLNIRQMRSSGASLRKLAARFGCSEGAIHHICTGSTWKHNPGPITPTNTDRRVQYDKMARLDDEAVRKIRAMRSAGLTYAAIAAKYDVGLMTIRDIIKGVTWKHVL